MTPPTPPTAESLDAPKEGSPAASVFDWLPLLSLAFVLGGIRVAVKEVQ